MDFKPRVFALLMLSALAQFALADPPGRVGRISYIEGDVEFRDGVNDQAAASINWPVTSSNVLSTVGGARSELRIGSTTLRLGPDTELEIQKLDDDNFQLYLSYGSVSVHVTDPEVAHQFHLVTPQGHIVMLRPTWLRADAERSQRTVGLRVLDGAAHFTGNDADLTVHEHSRIEVTDGSLSNLNTRDYARGDNFDAWVNEREHSYTISTSSQYVSADMTGAEELDTAGTWVQTTDYGPVWYPTTVVSGWAPYRYGHWAWVNPWGWTWVDNARWGYATTHYGRWVTYDGRWCWVPGQYVARPVWAPAVVGWVGGNNWSVTVRSGPSVGWFPLAPREVYVPTYAVSPTYVQQINVTHVTNINNITNINYVNGVPRIGTPFNYHNRLSANAVTVLPQASFQPGAVVAVTPNAAISAQQVASLQKAPVTYTPPLPTGLPQRPNSGVPGGTSASQPMPQPGAGSTRTSNDPRPTGPTVLNNASTLPAPTGRVLTSPTVATPNTATQPYPRPSFRQDESAPRAAGNQPNATYPGSTPGVTPRPQFRQDESAPEAHPNTRTGTSWNPPAQQQVPAYQQPNQQPAQQQTQQPVYQQAIPQSSGQPMQQQSVQRSQPVQTQPQYGNPQPAQVVPQRPTFRQDESAPEANQGSRTPSNWNPPQRSAPVPQAAPVQQPPQRPQFRQDESAPQAQQQPRNEVRALPTPVPMPTPAPAPVQTAPRPEPRMQAAPPAPPPPAPHQEPKKDPKVDCGQNCKK